MFTKLGKTVLRLVSGIIAATQHVITHPSRSWDEPNEPATQEKGQRLPTPSRDTAGAVPYHPCKDNECAPAAAEVAEHATGSPISKGTRFAPEPTATKEANDYEIAKENLNGSESRGGESVPDIPFCEGYGNESPRRQPPTVEDSGKPLAEADATGPKASQGGDGEYDTKTAAKPKASFVAVLNAAELIIRQEIGKADASPFLAHCDVKEHQAAKILSAYVQYLSNNPSRIPDSFKRWPLVAVWAFAMILSEDYGEANGPVVYPLLKRRLGADPEEVREQTSQQFRRVCRRFRLCFEGRSRMVSDYLAQAGIAKFQLHFVANAFLYAERCFGPIPADSTSALKSWQDDAASLLPPGVRVPRMVLEVDESAYYASLFARFRNDTARNAVERAFFDELARAESSCSRTEARPRLLVVWAHNALALSLPKVDGRISLTIDGVIRKLRGGQKWLIPTPWPTRIEVAAVDRNESVCLFPAQDSILAFDGESGRLLLQIGAKASSDTFVDAREVMLVSRSAFSVDEEEAYAIGSGGYNLFSRLRPEGVQIKSDGKAFRLCAKPKPRIWIESALVAKGAKGALVMPKSVLCVECGDADSDGFDLAIYINGKETITPLAAGSLITRSISALLGDSAVGTDVLALKAELRLRGSKRALISQKFWLWRGLREFDGLLFDSEVTPLNFLHDCSRHIVTDDRGRLCLDADAAYDQALLSFRVQHERIDFEFPKPGAALSLIDGDGRTIQLRVGDPLVLREEDKAGFLRVRSPDRTAVLNVRGRLEPHAFRNGAEHVLSVSDLLRPVPNDEITLRTASGVVLLLARIVPAASPRKFKGEQRQQKIILRIEMPIEIDAVRLEIEDELGNCSTADCDLMRGPFDWQCQSLISGRMDENRIREAIVTADVARYSGEFALARISVRPLGSNTFRPLRNARGDIFALVLRDTRSSGAFDPTSHIPDRFRTLNAWMSLAYASECSGLVHPYLQPRWMEMGKTVRRTPDGLRLLISAAHEVRPAAAKNWVSVAHPLQIDPDLYAAPASDFGVLAANDADGADHLFLLGKIAGRRVRDLFWEMGVSGAFMRSFSNFEQAQRTGEALAGFDFCRYVEHFATEDRGIGGEWFWRPGDKLLGREHYGSAIGRLVERIYEAGIDEEGANDERFSKATSLAHQAAQRASRQLPQPVSMGEALAIVEWAPAFFAEFAKHCRAGQASVYLERMAMTLNRPLSRVLGDAAFLIRLAPELFAFYLILWELGRGRQHE